jgi:hypothetical protein
MLGCVTPGPPVVPSVTTFDSGSGNFTVPKYNTLTVEVWGPGRGGYGCADSVNLSATTASAATSASSVSTLGMTANGGGNGSNSGNIPGGLAGGTASGGNDTNTSGTDGGPQVTVSDPGTRPFGGTGGSAGNGGGSVAGPQAPPTPSGTSQLVAGNAGTTPGGGGSGSAGTRLNFISTIDYIGYRGGPGGGYCKSVYVFGVTTAFPSEGDVLAWTVAAGTAGAGISAPGSHGGDGKNGRVRFTVA